MAKTELRIKRINYSELSDEEILKIISRDDSRAFEYLFKKYYTELTRFCLRFIPEESLAEEIAQEVFIKIWEKRQEIQLHSQLKAYLYTAVKNSAFNFLKSKFAQMSRIEPDESLSQVVQNSENHLEARELDLLIKKAVLNLPDKCRIIFQMSRQAGMSYKEIAASLEISVKTVEAQMGIALKKIKQYLEKHWDQILLIVLIHLKVHLESENFNNIISSKH